MVMRRYELPGYLSIAHRTIYMKCCGLAQQYLLVTQLGYALKYTRGHIKS